MRKIALTCATLAALLLVAVLGLGFYGQNSSAQTKDELSEETGIAEDLLQVKQAAENEKADTIAQLAQEKLEQLPQTSQDLAADSIDDSQPLKDSLMASANELIDTAYSTDNAELRVFLLNSTTQLWNEGGAEKIVEGDYPATLSDKIKELDVCEPAEDAAEAPDSVTKVMNDLDELTYSASLFSARADIDGYSTDETAAVNDANDEAALWRSRANNTLSCSYKLPARQAAYSVDSKEPQTTLDALKKKVQDDVTAAIADPAVTEDQALTELLVLQKNFK